MTAPAPSSVHVEFLGLPGAGKTTVSRAVAAALRARLIPVTEPTYRLDHVASGVMRQAAKLWYSWRRIVRRPRTSARWAQAVLGSQQRAFASSLVEAMNVLYLLELIRSEAARPGVHLFDQGLFQALWSLGYDAAASDVIAPPMVEQIRECLPRAAVVVLVEASVDAALARLRARPGTTSRVQRDVAAGRSALAFERATGVLRLAEAAVREIAQDGRITVLRVCNETDEKLMLGTARVADALSDVLRGAYPTPFLNERWRAG